MRVPAVIAVLIGLLLAPAALAADLMPADKARTAALAGEVVLIDIRTPEEWAETGVPDAAYTLNMHGEGFVPKLKAIMDAHPGKPLALICAQGGRSSYLSTALEQRKIVAFNVREGMLGSKDGPGWLARSMPIRTADAPRVEE